MKVLAASVLAIVAEVAGNVITVPSVQSNDNDAVCVSVLPHVDTVA